MFATGAGCPGNTSIWIVSTLLSAYSQRRWLKVRWEYAESAAFRWQKCPRDLWLIWLIIIASLFFAFIFFKSFKIGFFLCYPLPLLLHRLLLHPLLLLLLLLLLLRLLLLLLFRLILLLLRLLLLLLLRLLRVSVAEGEAPFLVCVPSGHEDIFGEWFAYARV